jgi:hypothetical protein
MGTAPARRHGRHRNHPRRLEHVMKIGIGLPYVIPGTEGRRLVDFCSDKPARHARHPQTPLGYVTVTRDQLRRNP